MILQPTLPHSCYAVLVHVVGSSMCALRVLVQSAPGLHLAGPGQLSSGDKLR